MTFAPELSRAITNHSPVLQGPCEVGRWHDLVVLYTIDNIFYHLYVYGDDKYKDKDKVLVRWVGGRTWWHCCTLQTQRITTSNATVADYSCKGGGSKVCF